MSEILFPGHISWWDDNNTDRHPEQTNAPTYPQAIGAQACCSNKATVSIAEEAARPWQSCCAILYIRSCTACKMNNCFVLTQLPILSTS